jgi:hypothetical protein
MQKKHNNCLINSSDWRGIYVKFKIAMVSNIMNMLFKKYDGYARMFNKKRTKEKFIFHYGENYSRVTETKDTDRKVND